MTDRRRTETLTTKLSRWTVVLVLDVTNLAPIDAAPAKPNNTVVLNVRRPIGRSTRKSVQDTCAR